LRNTKDIVLYDAGMKGGEIGILRDIQYVQ